MRFFLILLFLCLISCKSSVNKDNSATQNKIILPNIINFDSFKIRTPKGWKQLKMRGIDSYVGGITNCIDTLTFDFGDYSNDLLDECENQLYADDTINGKIGYITKPKMKGKGFLGVYFGDIDGEKFNLCTYGKPTNVDTIISIFQTIQFKTSDTTRNTQTLRFLPRSR